MTTHPSELLDWPVDLREPDDAVLFAMEQARLVPHDADDRAYLLLLYAEHAALARQQEALRAAWSGLVTAMCVALLAFGAMDERLGGATLARHALVAGLLACAASALGVVLYHKHSERYDLHLSIMRGFRNVLAQRVRADIPKITTAATIQHNRAYRLSRRFVSMKLIWRTVFLAAFLAGAGMAWVAVDTGGLGGDAAFVAPHIGTAMPDHIPLIAGATR